MGLSWKTHTLEVGIIYSLIHSQSWCWEPAIVIGWYAHMGPLHLGPRFLMTGWLGSKSKCLKSEGETIWGHFPFYYPASEVIEHLFRCMLLIEAFTKVHPGLRRGKHRPYISLEDCHPILIEVCRKGRVFVCVCITMLRKYNLPFHLRVLKIARAWHTR